MDPMNYEKSSKNSCKKGRSNAKELMYDPLVVEVAIQNFLMLHPLLAIGDVLSTSALESLESRIQTLNRLAIPGL